MTPTECLALPIRSDMYLRNQWPYSCKYIESLELLVSDTHPEISENIYIYVSLYVKLCL